MSEIGARQPSSAPTPLGTRWARRLVCSRSGEEAELDRRAALSSDGAPYLVDYELDVGRGEAWRRALPRRPWTLWRYRELLPVAGVDGRVDLGAGGTPLIAVAWRGREMSLKEESGNPTGSFKARGLSIAVNRARELGAPGVELASAGNAALALTAYAAAASLPARVALPDRTPGVVAERCRRIGAEVIRGGATLVESRQLLAADDRGFWDLSTLREPYRVEGKKTMAFELVEQLAWEPPDWIVYPTGGGTGIIGMHKGFSELQRLGLIGDRRPRFVAVQMAGCAPIVRAFTDGRREAEPWESPATEVWGLRVPRALGDFLVLRALRETDGRAVTVTEEEVRRATEEAAREHGLLVGPEGAATLAGTAELVADGVIEEGDSVVAFQTGRPGNYRE